MTLKPVLFLLACAALGLPAANATTYNFQRVVPTLVVDSGIPPAPLAQWQTTVLDFAGVPVGSSTTKTAVLKNIGTAPGDFSSLSNLTAGVQANTSACTSVAPNSGCTVSFTYAPTAMSPLAISGVVPAGVASDNQLALSGVGLLTAGSLTAGSLDFDPLNVGSVSNVKTVALTNSGNTPLSVGLLSFTGPFTAETDCGNSLAAGSLCHINVRFAPSAVGSATGEVTLQSAVGTQTVTLTGTGTAAMLAFEDSLGATVAQLNYSAALGTSAAPQTVYVKNTGNANLTVGAVTVPAPFALQSNGCSTVAPGARCALSITFTPAAQTSYSVLVSVASNALSSGALTLSGTGGAPNYAILSLSTAKVPSGGTLSADKLTLTPAGGGSQILVATNLAGKTSGKWYFEVSMSNVGCSFCEFGIMPASAIGTVTSGGSVAPVGSAYYFSGGGGTGGGIAKGVNSWVATGLGQSSNTPLGVALDLDNRQVTFKLATQSYGPYSLASPVGTAYVPFVTSWGSNSVTANFGQKAFSRGVPTGYNAGWY